MAAAAFQSAHEVGGERYRALQQRDNRPAVVDLRGEAVSERVYTRGDFVRFEKYAQTGLSRW